MRQPMPIIVRLRRSPSFCIRSRAESFGECIWHPQALGVARKMNRPTIQPRMRTDTTMPISPHSNWSAISSKAEVLGPKVGREANAKIRGTTPTVITEKAVQNSARRSFPQSSTSNFSSGLRRQTTTAEEARPVAPSPQRNRMETFIFLLLLKILYGQSTSRKKIIRLQIAVTFESCLSSLRVRATLGARVDVLLHKPPSRLRRTRSDRPHAGGCICRRARAPVQHGNSATVESWDPVRAVFFAPQ